MPNQGRPSLEAMLQFPLVSYPPYFQKHFLTPWKIFPISPFPTKFSDFHPSKYVMTFFSHLPQILNSPYFRCFDTFPYYGTFFFSPTFTKYPPHFVNFTCFLHTYCVFRFPLL